MKKTLLSLFFLGSAAVAMAQVDITPSRYVFSSQPTGSYEIDFASTGANPAANLAAAVDDFNGGYIGINNGQMGGKDKPNALAVINGTQIVDLGGEVGKVLCIKGQNSTYAFGTPSDNAMTVGWWNMSFYTDKENTLPDTSGDDPVPTPVRFSFVFKIVNNTPDATNNHITLDAYTYSNNNWGAKNTVPAFKSGDFIQTYEDGEPVLDDDENYINDETKWIKYEMDFSAPDVEGAPLRFVIKFAGQNPAFNNTAFLVKELTVTKNPTGDPVTGEVLNYKPGDASSISSVIFGDNANQKVYTLDGRKVSSPAAKGLYIVNGKKLYVK